MKRSEMITLIANKLFEDHCFQQYKTHYTAVYCLDKAEELLNVLEESGMLPPSTIKYNDKPEGNCEWDEE